MSVFSLDKTLVTFLGFQVVTSKFTAAAAAAAAARVGCSIVVAEVVVGVE